MLAVVWVASASAFTGAVASARAPTRSPAPSAHSAAGVPGLPYGAPPAATRPEPRLPAPAGWPFAEAFPRTSGEGRLAGGASYWSDFLYDDHGAFGSLAGNAQAAGGQGHATFWQGSYQYPGGPARNNGADVFRAAVGLTRDASYWRVDWNTLADPGVPIAEWTLDTDDDAATGGSAWPANAGLRSAGIERALVVSSRGARLLDVASGRTLASLPTTVDRSARSFLVRVPRSLMPVGGRWRVRLAAGLADGEGTGFATVPPDRGAQTGGANVYNISFRSREQEGPLFCPVGQPLPTSGHVPTAGCGNFWNENYQAQTLTTGDVSELSRRIDWSALARRETTPEPLPTGYSVRWYVSGLDLGQGVVPQDFTITDLKPNFLGRVQPYSVYVPKGYDPAKPTPLSWILHSLSTNHNQYAGLAPTQLQQQCEDRGSICATTLGFGPDGWYFDEAEVDFWGVWQALATTYRLDPDATVISGYSMGGWASYKLGLAYPDLLAKAMPMEGPTMCGVRVAGDASLSASGGAPEAGGHCGADGDTTPLVVNARWLPYVIVNGVIDQLVPITSGLEQIAEFDRRDYRYDAIIYPAEDHGAFVAQNDFTPAISRLGQPKRAIDPGHISYAWYPDLTRADYGIGPTGAYWIRGLTARDRSPGAIARVDAVSHAIPDPAVVARRDTSTIAELHPTPAVLQQLTWAPGATPAAKRILTLDLENVAALGVDMRRAGLRCGTVQTKTNGPATLRLLGLPAGRRLSVGGRTVATSSRTGRAVLPVAPGTTTMRVACSVKSGRRGLGGRNAGGVAGQGNAGRVARAAAGGQKGAGAGGSKLPFTGFLMIPRLIAGVALIAGGVALRRRVRPQHG